MSSPFKNERLPGPGGHLWRGAQKHLHGRLRVPLAGRPAYWTGRSPILFPIIGGLPEDRYTWKGQTYEMRSHGFAKRSEFSVVSHTDDALTPPADGQ